MLFLVSMLPFASVFVVVVVVVDVDVVVVVVDMEMRLWRADVDNLWNRKIKMILAYSNTTTRSTPTTPTTQSHRGSKRDLF